MTSELCTVTWGVLAWDSFFFQDSHTQAACCAGGTTQMTLHPRRTAT